MALFGRNQLSHPSTLSRFLAALDQSTVEALRILFQKVVKLGTSVHFHQSFLWAFHYECSPGSLGQFISLAHTFPFAMC
jgi:hypothetical protein